MCDDKPDHVTLHTGINDFRSEETPSQISRSIDELAMFLKGNDKSVIVSGIVPTHDNFNYKANEVNDCLVLMCKEQKIICHSDSIDKVNSSLRVSHI